MHLHVKVRIGDDRGIVNLSISPSWPHNGHLVHGRILAQLLNKLFYVCPWLEGHFITLIALGWLLALRELYHPDGGVTGSRCFHHLLQANQLTVTVALIHIQLKKHRVVVTA